MIKMKSVKSLLLALSLVIASAMQSLAAGNYTVPVIDLTDVYAAFAVLLTAVGAIWVGKQIYSFFRGK